MIQNVKTIKKLLEVNLEALNSNSNIKVNI